MKPEAAELHEMHRITKAELPDGTPPPPRNYVLIMDAAGQVFTRAPGDKRKSKGRVPEKPVVFRLGLDPEDNKLKWYETRDIQTLPIRNWMLHSGLKMEILFNMRMTAKAPKCSTILRQEYGMTGTPVSLYMQWCKFHGYVADPKVAQMAMAEGELA